MQGIEEYKSEKEYFKERDECVYNFINEEHFLLYTEHMIQGKSVRSINKLIDFSGENIVSEKINEDTVVPSIDANNFNEMFFKEFYCEQEVSALLLEKEIYQWQNYIERNSDFHVLFAVLAKDAFTNVSECFFLLREDREKEDFLRQ